MAKTYYKYAKRETTPVDYAGAAKDLSEGLMATVTGLEKKAEKAAGEVAAAKSKIEEEFAEEEERKRKEDEALQKQYGDKVSRAADLPLSYQEDYKTVQSTILDLSSDAADLKAKLKRDYEAGKMTTKDYNRRVNNIRDQFKMMKQTAVTSLEMVNSTNEAMQNGTALPIQHDMLTRILKGRFDSTNAQYNIDEEGNIFADITDPKTGKVEQMSVYDMNKLSMQRFDVFDIDGQAESLVKDIGQVLENERGSGMTTEQLLEKEVMQRGNEISTPMDYIKKNVNGYSENQLASILQMKMSQDYKRSMNPADFGNDDVVVYTISPISGQYEAKLTDNQKQAARDFATAAVLTQLNPLKKPTTSGKSPSSAQIAAGDAREKAAVSINTLADWYGAKTPKDRRTAAAGLATSLGDDFISLIPSPDGKTATLTSIQKVSGKDVQVDTDIAMEGVTFDQFIKSFGKALTGQDLSQYYSDFVSSGRTVDFAPIDPNISYGDGAYKKTFKQPPKDLSQNLADLGDWRANVVKTIDDITVRKNIIGMGGQTDDQVNESFEVAIRDNLFAAGISDYTVSRTDNTIKIEVDGLGEISVAVGRKDTDKAKVKKILSDVYTRVSKGEMLDGSGKPAGVNEKKGKKPTPIS